jgi:hypothetical protein
MAVGGGPAGGAAHCAGPPLTAQGRLRRRFAIAARPLTREPLRPLRAAQRGQAGGLPSGCAAPPAGRSHAAGDAVTHPVSARAPRVGSRDPSTGCVGREPVRERRRSFRGAHRRLRGGRGARLGPIIGVWRGLDRCFGAFSCHFRPFPRRNLDHDRRTVFGGAARPKGRPVGLPAKRAFRGRRGSRVKGRAAIAQRRRRRP